jgi:phytoene dehydrogenase-like protein
MADLPRTWDVIAVGSGHNGLVAAGYLAKAGKSVLVLERNAWFGGGVVSKALTSPGFIHDQHSMAHIFILANPLIKNDELGLVKAYGLKYVYPGTPFYSVFPDGEFIGLHRDVERTAKDIARFSEKDAQAYRDFAVHARTIIPMLVGTFFTPPAPVGAGFAMMDQSPQGREFMALLQKSATEVICEMFESDRVRCHFGRLVGENLASPDEKGTAIGITVFAGFMEAYGLGCPIGGSGQLTAALVRSIEDRKGKVVANADVTRVVVKNGRAVGVEVAGQGVFEAKEGVIGAIHPHDLGKMVEGVDPRIVAGASRVALSDNGCITIHAALNEPLKFKAGPHINKGYMIDMVPATFNELRRFFDELKYGFPNSSLLGVGSPTGHDPSRAPAGKATMHMWDYVPYDHPAGGAKAWDDKKLEHAEKMIARAKPYIENLSPSNIIAKHVDSPLDMERTSSSFRKGDIHGVAPAMHQMGAHRPTPDLGQLTVPGVERLYLVGPFMAPGGGVFGAGRASAVKMLADLKIDFAKVAAA